MLQEGLKPTPDRNAIRADLLYMTRRWHELAKPAMFEVRCFKEDSAPTIFKYAPDWIDDAVDQIADMNARGRNCYAVRNPIRANATGSATDKDILAAFFLWADCDDPAAAGNVYRFDGPKWSAAVTTGTKPSVRAHVYWELETPCTDLSEWHDMQATIAAHFGSDSSVINPSRIMRIGGTVSWPFRKKQERGYVVELTTIRTAYDDSRTPVTIDQMRRVFSSRTPAKPLQPSLSAQATPTGARFEIDTGAAPQSLDRERATIQALSGQEWHNAVIRLVGSYVAKGLSDTEIHALTQPLTLPGYTTEQTAREVQTAIDGARRKGWTPEPQYADPRAMTIPAPQAAAPEPSFDAPKRPLALEWFDDIQPSLSSPYIVKGILDHGTMSVVYGPSNSGKTFWAMDLTYAVAIGAPWRGRRVKQTAVLYLAAEGGKGVINRASALKQTHGVCDVPFAVKRAGLDLLHEQADLQHIYDLAAEVMARKPGLPLMIVVDTLSRIMAGGDENSAADMTALIRNLDAIREATGAHVMVIHHTGKDTARGARGHSSLRAATDTEIEVANDNGARAAMVTKQRDHKGGETFAFSLKSVALGVDEDGDDVTSCVVEEVDAETYAAEAKRTKGLGGTQKLIADTFDQMLSEGLGRPNPGGVGMPEPGQFWTVERAELRRICMGKIEATDPRSSFNKAFAALTQDRGLFVSGENLVWRVDKRVKQ